MGGLPSLEESSLGAGEASAPEWMPDSGPLLAKSSCSVATFSGDITRMISVVLLLFERSEFTEEKSKADEVDGSS